MFFEPDKNIEFEVPRDEHKEKTEKRTLGKSQAEFLQLAACVQRSSNSRNFAVHVVYRSSLRSSSLLEPRHRPR